MQKLWPVSGIVLRGLVSKVRKAQLNFQYFQRLLLNLDVCCFRTDFRVHFQEHAAMSRGP